MIERESTDWPVGKRVRFRDSTATTRSGIVVREGTVNGPALFNNHDEQLAFVPVWSERDGGREPTTVYVAASNLLTEVVA